MSWIFLVLIAQFIFALVALIDRHLLVSPKVEKPPVYAFYVGALSIVGLLILPFGVVTAPSSRILLLSLVSGLSFVLFALFLYKALKVADASDAVPVFNAIGAIATLALSFLLFNNRLGGNFLKGFIFLVAGTLVMSYFRFSKKVLVFLIVGGVFFGLSSISLKWLFSATSFWDGLFWSRMANVLAAFLLFLWPGVKKSVAENMKRSSASTKSTVVGNQVLSSAGTLLTLYAVKLGEVCVINALNGAQFVFLLLLALILAPRFPNIFYETVGGRVILQKFLAMVLIITGLIFLFL